MPSSIGPSRISKIENRFRQLESLETKLAFSKKKLGQQPADRVPISYNPEDRILDSRSARGVQLESAGGTLRGEIQGISATRVSLARTQTRRFFDQQELLRSLPVDISAEYQGLPREANATEGSSIDPNQFTELFMDSEAYETRAEFGLISRLVGSNEPRSETDTLETKPVMKGPAADRVKAEEPVRSSTTGVNPFRNPKPLRLRLPLGSTKKDTKLKPVDSVPVQRSPSPKRGSPSKPANGSPIADFMTKEFYDLHIRLQHSTGRLTDWEFEVVVTDVTYAERRLRHTFRNVRVNKNMYIVFHPPDGIVLSMLQDIPWVSGFEQVFHHKFRIEVFATFPNRSQVIDSLVYFGETVPSNV